MNLNNRNTRFELTVYGILGLGYIALNVLYQKKLAVLIFILTTLLYIIFHKIFSKDKMLINKIPYIFVITIIVNAIHDFIFSFEEKKDDNPFDLNLPVP